MKKLQLFLFPFFLLVFVFAKCEDDDKPIELSSSIKNYLNEHYPGYELEGSENDTLCNGKPVVDVEIEPSEDQELELVFDTEGTLLYTETDIKTADLPAAVKASIAGAFAGYATKEAARLTLPAGGTQYEAGLKKGSTRLEVIFEAEGTVVCQKEE